MTIVVGVVVLVGLVMLAILGHTLSRADTRPVHRRGGKLLTLDEVKRALACRPHGQFVPPANCLGIWFGGLWLTLELAWTGMLIIGEIGIGKTSVLSTTVRSILKIVKSRCGARLFLGDPKLEFTSGVAAEIPPFVRLVILNPNDKRSTRWDLAKDFTSPAEAQQLAAALIPEDKSETQKYWPYSARAVLTRVIRNLMREAPGRWTLRDVLYICQSRKLLVRYLRRTQAGARLAEKYLKAKSGRDVLASLGSHLDKYEPVVAAWDRSATAVSIREILDSECVVILGLDESISAAVNPLFTLFMKRVTDEILARNNPLRPSWVVFDELPRFGKLDLTPLTLKGRSAGAAVVATMMDLAALEVALGEKEARSFIGSLLTHAYFRVSSDHTAEFISKEIGEHEVLESDTSRPEGSGQRTISTKVVNRRLVLPDEVKNLPGPNWHAGRLSGYFRLAGIGTYRADVDFRTVPAAPRTGVPDYDRRPPEDQVLRPFDKHDLARLGLPLTPQWLSLFQVKVI